MAPVVRTIAWIVIVPLAVVNRDLHFGRIPIVQAIAATVILVAVEILLVVDVRIVLESRVVSVARSATPRTAISIRLLGLRVRSAHNSNDYRERCDEDCPTQHDLPPGMVSFSLFANTTRHVRLEGMIGLNLAGS